LFFMKMYCEVELTESVQLNWYARLYYNYNN
jgi:hypothetical protein